MKSKPVFIVLLILVICLTAFSFIGTSKATKNSTVAIIETLSDDHHVPTAFEANTTRSFIYDIGPRFGGITKRELNNASSVNDFLSAEELARMETFQELTVIIIENDIQTNKRISNNTAELSKAQKDFLTALPLSTNFLISARFLERENGSSSLKKQHWRPHLTIVPDVQANYSEGLDALKKYIEKGIYEHTVGVEEEKLSAAKLYFTITKDGTLKNLFLDRSSGYPEIDAKMKTLLLEAPGKWQSAKDVNGTAVEQVLTVSFGLEGC